MRNGSPPLPDVGRFRGRDDGLPALQFESGGQLAHHPAGNLPVMIGLVLQVAMRCGGAAFVQQGGDK